MSDQSPPDRYKAEMPQIPGVSAPGSGRSALNNPAIRMVGALLAILLVIFFGARWILRPRHAEAPPAEPPPQIEVPSPAPDPNAALPHATQQDPGIASVPEMAQPWTSKQFFIRNAFSGENVKRPLIPFPTGFSSPEGGYWAFSMNAP